MWREMYFPRKLIKRELAIVNILRARIMLNTLCMSSESK